MKTFLFFSILYWGVISPAYCVTHPDAGKRNSGILNTPLGVRPAGMGNAYVAVSNDIHSIYTNPAGLGALRHVEVNLLHNRKFEGISQSHVALSIPTGLVSAGGVRNFGTFAASIGILDYGDLDGRDNLGNASPLDLGAREVMLTASYGKTFYDRLSLGVNTKFYYLQYSEAFSRDMTYDLGAQYQASSRLWKAGILFKNLGHGIRLIETDEDLYQSVTVGVALMPFADRLTLSFDIEDPDDNDIRYKTGLEYWATHRIALRTGYDSTNDIGLGITAGLSLRVRDMEIGFFPIRHMTFDYAFVPSSNLGDVHQFAITFHFGDQ